MILIFERERCTTLQDANAGTLLGLGARGDRGEDAVKRRLRFGRDPGGWLRR